MIRTKLFNQIFWTNSRRLFAAGCSGDLPCVRDVVRHARRPRLDSRRMVRVADSKTMKIYLHYRPADFELDLLNAAEAGPKTPLKCPQPRLARTKSDWHRWLYQAIIGTGPILVGASGRGFEPRPPPLVGLGDDFGADRADLPVTHAPEQSKLRMGAHCAIGREAAKPGFLAFAAALDFDS
jgi:hypothetical protein